jgi:hypothetical protein
MMSIRTKAIYMRIDGIQLQEGSNISNLVVASGNSFPALPNEGELFFRSDIDVRVKGLYGFINGSWDRISSSAALTTPAGTNLPQYTNANIGELFYLSTNDAREGLYVFTGTAWASIAESTGPATRRQQWTVMSSESTFVVSGGYTVGAIDVFLNGLKVRPGNEMAVFSSPNIVFVSGSVQAGDEIDAVIYDR